MMTMTVTMTMMMVAAAMIMINPRLMVFMVALAVMPMIPDHVKDGAHDEDDDTACHYIIHHSACEDAYGISYKRCLS